MWDFPHRSQIHEYVYIYWYYLELVTWVHHSFMINTPWKINMEPKNGGLVQMIFLFNWVISSFHREIFRGVSIQSLRFVPWVQSRRDRVFDQTFWVIFDCHMGVKDSELTWPVAKRLKLFGITYLVGKISRSNCFFQGPLAKWVKQIVNKIVNSIVNTIDSQWTISMVVSGSPKRW